MNWSYPAIKGYGPVVALPGFDSGPRESLTYKVVFNVTQGRPGDGRVNPGLASVARFVNLLALDGGLPDDAQIAAGDAAYWARYGAPNPNTELISRLSQLGVDVVVCGQTLVASGFTPQAVLAPVDVALSAMTAIASRQLQGFAVMS